MKAKIPTTIEVNITHILLELAIRYGDEEMPNDFPLREGDLWKAKVEIDTGRILDWPAGRSADLHLKVCDEGTYTLLDENGKLLAKLENEYVPHGVVPGSYGDYVEFTINEDGIITNWRKKPDVSDFFTKEDE